MLRRRHKKSRAGCLECKRRHVKCDEQRPNCRICTLSDRPCAYPVDDANSRISIPDITDIAPVLSAQESVPDVNMIHMELLGHFFVEPQILAAESSVYTSGMKLLMNNAMQAPYLMYETLAISARHLAVVSPQKSDFYLQQAVKLQTQAVSIFNEQNIQVDKSNCVSMLLFTYFLCNHLLADVLARRDPSLDLFLDRYTDCFQIHRGLRAVAIASWEDLLKSELGPFLTDPKERDRTVHGHETEKIKGLVAVSPNLTEIEKGVCFEAIASIQLGIDATTAPERIGDWSEMIFMWSVAVPESYIDLLVRRKGEALAILGHYALLLHYGTELWQVGDSGPYILGLISNFLGRDWDSWLAVPREKMIGT
ncbi:hypothetical protein GQ53DRAFT_887672 [Thozetella sp. PMI_491]|nr:hypothetical protein GQ53DRAFT_887672 [Thozetella sp. PMI_491]